MDYHILYERPYIHGRLLVYSMESFMACSGKCIMDHHIKDRQLIYIYTVTIGIFHGMSMKCIRECTIDYYMYERQSM
jgi:hypothetical protein